jgi:hypothetical protein
VFRTGHLPGGRLLRHGLPDRGPLWGPFLCPWNRRLPVPRHPVQLRNLRLGYADPLCRLLAWGLSDGDNDPLRALRLRRNYVPDGLHGRRGLHLRGLLR